MNSNNLTKLIYLAGFYASNNYEPLNLSSQSIDFKLNNKIEAAMLFYLIKSCGYNAVTNQTKLTEDNYKISMLQI